MARRAKVRPKRPVSAKARREPGRPKAAKARQRENGILLTDLFMWVGIAEACLEHPVGGLGRAAVRLAVGEPTIQQCINRLERSLGFQLVSRSSPRDPRKPSARRSGLLLPHGVLFAEACAAIEHLWTFGSSGFCLKFFADDLHTVKDVVFSLLCQGPRRGIEKERYLASQKARFDARGFRNGRLGYLDEWHYRFEQQKVDLGSVDLLKLPRLNIPK